jgi:4-hydroxy-2-oxoheptanedioate aldolase
MSTLRARWARDETVHACWLTLPDPLAAEILACQGWPALVVDLQHGALDDAIALNVLQALHGTGCAPLVRLPWPEPAAAMRALDRGAEVVIAPMVAGVEQAARFVAACLYPPQGERSWGPVRAGLESAPTYAAEANQRVVPIVQVETVGALADLDAMLALPGLGGVFVGPNDLGWALGFGPGSDREEPELVAIIEDIARRARAAGRLAGIHCGTATHARRMAAVGYRLITIGSDASLLAQGGRSLLASL